MFNEYCYFKAEETNTIINFTCKTKSLPLKSAIVLGKRVLPHTNLKNKDLSVLLNSSITSQNHWTKGASGSMPLYEATAFNN